ncbi:MAG: 8-oxo-dGTP diphosphatase [Lentisphaeria bacterium]|nr:8-oxo-dGTP diphosphatase [Lentisphaeria bacterium]
MVKKICQNATLCYLRNQGDILMMHRVKKEQDYHKGKWNALGGKFEPGEVPSECARREIFEESGIQIDKLEFKGTIMFPNFDTKKDWLVFIYTAETTTRKFKESSEGELKWIPQSELLSLNLWEGDRIFIPWLNDKRYFEAKFSYVNKKLVDYKVDFYQ